jgi:SAM-dependent methyltransferase
MAKSTERFFNEYARDFDAIYGTRRGALNSLLNRTLRSSMKLRYEKTLAGCDPIAGRSVLDVGCGPGHYAVELASRGAGRVIGIDFAESMIELAKQHAQEAGVAERCHFEVADFLTYPQGERFDCVILMGFMDYMEDPLGVIRKALALASSRVFWSFPVAGGFLAWQRKLRYRSRCELYLYDEPQLRRLFAEAGAPQAKIEKIARDYFVSVDVAASAA